MTTRRCRAPLLAVAWLFIADVVAAQASDPAAAAAIFRGVRRVRTPDGLQAEGFVQIGGIAQWISVRGRHAGSPILLMLHGGPGFTSIPTSYFYSPGWEEYFTVASWDQRGAGKTYGANRHAAPEPALTIERMQADAEEVVAYLRKTYAREKIVVVGHSWGTVLGLELAHRHPEWLYAYVGIGQVIDFRRSETLGYAATLAAARAAGDAPAVAELESIAPFPDSADAKRTLLNLGRERHWLNKYGGVVWRGDEDVIARVGRLSPDYSRQDFDDRDDGLDLSLRALWGPLAQVSFLPLRSFACPVVFLHGRHDLVVSATVLQDWFEGIGAPHKELVWFEDSAHMVPEEEPGKVLVTLVGRVLPLTERPH